jgi:hypothetical protein
MPPAFVVVLPVYRPDPGHLSAQVASIAAQSVPGVHVVFVAADTTSGPAIRRLAADTGLDHSLVEPAQPLDAPRAVETGLRRALDLAGPDTLLALADQDDIWHPDRLAEGARALAAGAALAHSDARIIDGQGGVLHGSMFRFERRHRRPGLRGLLLRNNVTGMTLTMRRTVADLALPFPQQAGVHFYHDLWLALVAAATGGIAFIPRPTVDYRQHGQNLMGAVDRTDRPRFRPRLPDALWLRREAAAYALARFLAVSLANRLSDAAEDGRLAAPPRLRPLWPNRGYLSSPFGHLWDMARLTLTGHLRLARIALGHLSASAGRIGWTLGQVLGPGLAEQIAAFDERLYSLAPGLPPMPSYADRGETGAVTPAARHLDARKFPRFRPLLTAPDPGVVVLVPTLNPTEIYAGVATAVDIGAGLAARGYRVRFLSTDLPVNAPDATRQFILGRMPPAATPPRIDILCGARTPELAFHPDDTLLASAWWSAHIIRHLQPAGFRRRRFLYLIQDHEPNFYAWGPEYADAQESYGFDFVPLFNTTLLRDHFAALGHAFATPDALCFQPSIDIARYAAGTRPPSPARRRLAVYGRPAIPRNMFPTAVEALELFLGREGLTPDQVELLSVGMRHPHVTLAGGHRLTCLGKLPLSAYPDWLLGVDVGLSLMLSPHPSHPPLEMATAGVRVVTNRFGPKDLSRLTPAILSVDPTPQAVADGLSRAWALGPAADADRRFTLDALGDPLEAVIARLDAMLRRGP